MLRVIHLITTLLMLINISALSEQQVVNNKTLVNVGLYLVHIDKIDVKAQTFYAEFYLNMKWKGNHSPSSFELVNSNDFQKYFYEEWFEKDSSWLTCKVRGAFRCKMDVSDFQQVILLKLKNFYFLNSSSLFKAPLY